jgi:hypothetical protein
MVAKTTSECDFEAARQQLNSTIDWIEQAARDGVSAHAAEKFLQLQAKALPLVRVVAIGGPCGRIAA